MPWGQAPQLVKFLSGIYEAKTDSKGVWESVIEPSVRFYLVRLTRHMSQLKSPIMLISLSKVRFGSWAWINL